MNDSLDVVTQRALERIDELQREAESLQSFVNDMQAFGGSDRAREHFEATTGGSIADEVAAAVNLRDTLTLLRPWLALDVDKLAVLLEEFELALRWFHDGGGAGKPPSAVKLAFSPIRV